MPVVVTRGRHLLGGGEWGGTSFHNTPDLPPKFIGHSEELTLQ